MVQFVTCEGVYRVVLGKLNPPGDWIFALRLKGIVRSRVIRSAARRYRTQRQVSSALARVAP